MMSKKHTKKVLIAGHDSLGTTEDNFKVLKREFNELLNNYFGIDVVLGE